MNMKYHCSFAFTVLVVLLLTTVQIVVVHGEERVISNMSQFIEFRTAMESADNSDTVTLECDLDFTGMTGLLPIGVSPDGITVYSFRGTFKGNGHWIRGLKINTLDKTCEVSGLFGRLNSGVVSDLKYDEDCEFIGIKAGCLAGELTNSGPFNVTNIHNYGKVEGENVGGIIGYLFSSVRQDIDFVGCQNHGEVTAIMKSEKESLTLTAGGITGTLSYPSNNYVQHISCTNHGPVTIHVSGLTNNVKSLTCRCGGILGGHDSFSYGDNRIMLCNNSGPVSIVVDDYSAVTALTSYTAIAGGIFGYSVASWSINQIFQCINMGNVSVTSPPPSSSSFSTKCYAAGISGFIEILFPNRFRNDLINVGTIKCDDCTASGIDNADKDRSDLLNIVNTGNVIGKNAYGISNKCSSGRTNLVSIGKVDGTGSSQSVFSCVPTGSSSDESTFFVMHDIGCSDENEYKQVYQAENSTWLFEQNGTVKKLSDTLNANSSECEGYTYIWPEWIKKIGVIVRFYGIIEREVEVEPGTKLSDIIDSSYRIFLENDTEADWDMEILHDMKLFVFKSVSNFSVTIKVNDTENVDQQQIINEVKKTYRNCVIHCQVIDGNTILLTISVESGSEEEAASKLEARKAKCEEGDVLCNIDVIILFLPDVAVTTFVDMMAMILFVISCYISTCFF